MREEVTLTPDEWMEIYYAIDSKQNAIRSGNYGPEESPGRTHGGSPTWSPLRRRSGRTAWRRQRTE